MSTTKLQQFQPSDDPLQLAEQALRLGGFVSLLPTVIEASWTHPGWAKFAGFPLSVCFTGLNRNRKSASVAPLVTACYWFEPDSYREQGGTRSMAYFTEPRSRYHVVLTYQCAESRWEGRKYRDGKVVLLAYGTDMDHLTIQLTLRGIDRGEVVLPFVTYAQTASEDVYVFTPSP